MPVRIKPADEQDTLVNPRHAACSNAGQPFRRSLASDHADVAGAGVPDAIAGVPCTELGFHVVGPGDTNADASPAFIDAALGTLASVLPSGPICRADSTLHGSINTGDVQAFVQACNAG